MQTAIVAGGCFWCTEAVYNDVQGVSGVESGYIGGETENPTYKEVCSGRTGHAEAVKITYNPDIVRYGDLCDPRSDAIEPAGQRCRHPVPIGDLSDG